MATITSAAPLLEWPFYKRTWVSQFPWGSLAQLVTEQNCCEISDSGYRGTNVLPVNQSAVSKHRGKLKAPTSSGKNIHCPHPPSIHHWTPGTTQCYLPPGRGDIRAFTPAEAGTRFSDTGGMQCAHTPPSVRICRHIAG